MNTRKLTTLFAILAALILSLGACSQAATQTAPVPAGPVAVQEQAPVAAPVTTDIKAVVGDYLTNMPDGFNAVKDVDALKALMSSADPLIVDVREPSEYAEGHIAGAVNIPLRTIAQNLDKIPADRPVVVMCASGLRASYATTALQVLGFSNARVFYPSYKGWTAANEPVTTEATEAAVVASPKAVDPTVQAEVDTFLTNLPDGYFVIGKAETLKEMIDAGNVTVVDIREPSEFADGHIPGAINIPFRSLPASLGQIPTDQPAVISCASGLRAALAASALQIEGLSNVRTFTPSFKGWSAAGLEIVK